LKSVHDAGYLHGDVHAGNFLIRDGRVCLIDFGLTRPVRIAKKEESKYEEGGVVLYMPPEYVRRVFNGRKGFWGSVAGEIYSCAVILYFLFTKRMPYTWKYYREEYMKCILNQPPLSFEENGRTPWSELEVVLQRALAKRKKDRFASMGHFLKTLKKVHLPDAADENPFLEEVTDTQAEREGDR
ncbi:MAG: protein kinase, partial [Candidatus Zixiibacteriota bacterium]